MKPIYTFLSIFLFVWFGCTPSLAPLNQWETYDETEELTANSDHPIARMRYRRIQSKHSDRNALFLPFKKELSEFNQEDYDALKPYILEQDIPNIQKHINSGHLTYEQLTLFYIYRMYLFELDCTRFLNAIISLNPNVLEQAREYDRDRQKGMEHPLYGMPILLKDNMDATPMATTAGAAAMAKNFPAQDAFIVEKLKAKGASSIFVMPVEKLLN